MLFQQIIKDIINQANQSLKLIINLLLENVVSYLYG